MPARHAEHSGMHARKGRGGGNHPECPMPAATGEAWPVSAAMNFFMCLTQNCSSQSAGIQSQFWFPPKPQRIRRAPGQMSCNRVRCQDFMIGSVLTFQTCNCATGLWAIHMTISCRSVHLHAQTWPMPGRRHDRNRPLQVGMHREACAPFRRLSLCPVRPSNFPRQGQRTISALRNRRATCPLRRRHAPSAKTSRSGPHPCPDRHSKSIQAAD